MEPESAVCDKLLKATCPPQYAAVLAQLSNNMSGVALKIMQFAMTRATQLAEDDDKHSRSPLPTSPFLVKHSKSSLGVSKSGDKARVSMQSTFQSDVAVQRLFQEEVDPFEKSVLQKAIEFNGEQGGGAGGGGASAVVGTGRGHVVAKRGPDSDDDDDDEVITPKRPTFRAAAKCRPAPSPPQTSSPAIPKCSVCLDESTAKDDQLVNCTECQLSYHAMCVGARRIPFTLKSAKERENRSKYVAKHYSTWRCKSCKEQEQGHMASSPKSSSTGQSRDYIRGNSGSEELSGSERAGKTNSQDIAKLMSILSSTGLSLEDLVKMDESEQKAALLSAASQKNLSTGGLEDIQNKEGAILNDVLSALPSQSSQAQPQPPSQPPLDPRYNKYVKMYQVGLPVSIIRTKMKAEGLDPELVLNPAVPLPPLPLTSSQSFSHSAGIGRGPAGSGGLSRVGSSQHFSSRTTSNVSTASQDGEWQQLQPCDNPRYTKYFNMLKVGLPLTAVAQKLHSDGLAESVQIATMILNNIPPTPVPGAGRSGSFDTPVFTNDQATTSVSRTSSLSIDAGSGVPITHQLPQDTKNGDGSADEAKTKVDEKSEVETETATVANSGKKESAEPLIILQESMMYGKYFRMLKVGLPVNTIKMKMQQSGLDPSFLDKDPTDAMTMSDLAASRQKSIRSQESLDAEEKEEDEKQKAAASQKESEGDGEDLGECVPLKEHPVYGKYFKMLQVGLPLAMVRTKLLNQETDAGGVVDPDVLELDPATLHPVKLKEKEPEPKPEEMVALQDHPSYGKYLKMLKVGLPLVAAKAKMKEEGFDPDLLDRELTDMVPVDPTSTLRAKEKKAALPSSPKAKLVRKKKLHWKAIDASMVGKDSLWAMDDDDDADINLDHDEFNMLFVETESKPSAQSLARSSKDALAKKQQSLLDMKRGQNGGIALARLKMSFSEVRERILKMDDTAFTAEQFRSLQEYLPTVEESLALRRFVGDHEQLGVAERYMLEMLNNLSSPTIAFNCLECILFKQQFKSILSELNDSITRVENACDDVKMSPKLKKVLKTILKVGNQMNDGEQHRGFSLDSLLKLQSAKAFDKKTSVLQYIVRLIYRNDESCLQFPEDLVHLSDAARISVDSMFGEKATIEAEHAKCSKLIKDMRAEDDGTVELALVEDFLEKVSAVL